MRLRTRLTLLSAAAVAGAIILASTVVFFLVRSQLRGAVDDSLRAVAARVHVRHTPGGPAIELPDTEPFGESATFVRLVDENGRTYVAGGAFLANLPSSARARAVAGGRERAYFAELDVRAARVRVYTAPVRVAPGFAVQAFRSLGEVDRTLRTLALFLAGIAGGGLLLGGALGGLVARAAVGPVRRLTETAEHVTTTSDLSRRIEIGSRDELGRLAASFNGMLEALEGSLRAQRQLVADASHELRTPLTSVRTNIELLGRAETMAPDERARLIADVVGQLEELTALVADLVELAREGEAAEPEDVRLDEVAARAVERARRRFPSVRWDFWSEPSVVRAVAARLDRAIANLLDNAAKWTPEGGTVEVAARDGEVTVRDHGPGIAAEDRPHVFDRFYRAASARGMPGSGLGLSIVRQVAESSGGRVSAEPAEGGGELLRLHLPAAEDGQDSRTETASNTSFVSPNRSGNRSA